MVGTTRRNGFALLLALGIAFLIAVGVVALSRSLDVHSDTYLLEVRTIKLRALTDAALAEAVAQLDATSSRRGISSHNLADGTIESTVTVQGGGAYRVVGTGHWRSWTAWVTADVRIDRDGRAWITRWERTLRPGGTRGTASDGVSRLP